MSPPVPVQSFEGKQKARWSEAHTGGTMNLTITTILVAALLTATITDLKSQRIYNWLTFPLMLTGIILHTVIGGLDGTLLSLAGFGLGLAVMVVPFLFGMMGAGDVKLMAGLGALLGASNIFTAFIFTCLAGGVYSLVVLLRHRTQVGRIFANIKMTIMNMLVARRFEYEPVADAVLPRLCYGVAIAIGTTIAVGMNFARTGSVLAQ